MRHVIEAFKAGLQEAQIPPPYCANLNDLESCKGCEAPCVEACEENIITKDGIVFLDFTLGGCTFCEACAIACKEKGSGILNVKYGYIRVGIALDKQKCLAWNKTLCSYCGDVCKNRSVIFSAGLYPYIADSCTKCGMCYRVCPTSSIYFVQNKG